MEMKTVHIGDLGDIKTGSTPSKKNPDNYGDYALWIKPTDINPDEKYTRVVEEMFSEKAAHDCRTRLIPARSICMPCIGTVGTKLTMTPCDCFVNQSINAVIPNEDYDNNYVYYLLLNFLPNLKSINKGTASGREYIAKSAFENIEIQVHTDIDVQRAIGRILSAYDDMIDNCKQQIALLEEAAQRLYREWFVDMRFPGHETTPFGEDGLPKGWSHGKIDDVVIFFDSKRKPLSSLQRANMDKKYPYHGATSIMDYVDDYIFEGLYVLVGEDGSVIDNDGHPFVQLVNGKFWVNNHAHVLQGKGIYPTEYIYSFFKALHVNDVVTGSAQLKISQDRLKRKDTILPSYEVITFYSQIAQPIFQQLICKNNELIRVKMARDLLLPRLISGQIEINA